MTFNDPDNQISRATFNIWKRIQDRAIVTVERQ